MFRGEAKHCGDLAGAGRRDGDQPLRDLADGRGGGRARRADPAALARPARLARAHGAAFRDWLAGRPGAPTWSPRASATPGPARSAGWPTTSACRPRARRDVRERGRALRRFTDDEIRAGLQRDHPGPAAAGPDGAGSARHRGRPGDLAVDPHGGDRLGAPRADPARRHRGPDRPAGPARLGRRAARPGPRPRVGGRRPAADQPLRPADPDPPRGQQAAVRADAHRRQLGRAGTPTVTPSTTPSRVGWRGSTPPAPPASGRWSGPAGPRCSPCSTCPAAPRSWRR